MELSECLADAADDCRLMDIPKNATRTEDIMVKQECCEWMGTMNVFFLDLRPLPFVLFEEVAAASQKMRFLGCSREIATIDRKWLARAGIAKSFSKSTLNTLNRHPSFRIILMIIVKKLLQL